MKHSLATLLAFFLCISLDAPMNAIPFQNLKDALAHLPQKFNYPLGLNIIRGTSDNEEVLLCCHGYASDSTLATIIASYHFTNEHIVGFNFPDYLINTRGFNYATVCYGTPYELAPALILLKAMVNSGVKKVSLYGFSAGGGAIINLLSALNTKRFDPLLSQWGISTEDKAAIINALQKGIILLDAPLKSKEEISECNGGKCDPQSDFLTKRYRENSMRPIDALASLKGLNLNVVLFFQNPDEAVKNRDDHLFAQRLIASNPQGINKVIIANEGGHCGFHKSLWMTYQEMNKIMTEKVPFKNLVQQ